MSDQTARVTIPIKVYRRLQQGALRRGISIEQFTTQLIEGRLPSKVQSSQIAARRKRVAELLELHYSISDISRALNISWTTARDDRREVIRKQAAA
jgi:hypothetical protein